MPYTVTVPPTEEPVSLEEVKDQLNITEDFTDDDGLLNGFIVAAREYVENYTRRALLTQTIAARYDCFPIYFQLERAPLQSITTIQYVDTAGNTQTLGSSNYDVDIYSTPPRVTPAYSKVWPSVRTGVPNTVIITYVAGYAEPTDIPTTIKHAILLLVGHLYENREGTSVLTIKDIPFGINTLLMPYRVY